jgi:putative chitinase
MNLDKLASHIPADILHRLPTAAAEIGIDTPLKMAHFLAQCALESGNFTKRYENLNYSAHTLRSEAFIHHFPESLDLTAYIGHPEAIGSRLYASRMGNGNEASGDGWKFRGRGFLQLTGRENYTAFNKVVEKDILAEPDLVAEWYPLRSALWFYEDQKLVELSAKGATDDVVNAITQIINGGQNGAKERRDNFKLFYSLLQEQPHAAVAAPQVSVVVGTPAQVASVAEALASAPRPSAEVAAAAPGLLAAVLVTTPVPAAEELLAAPAMVAEAPAPAPDLADAATPA